MLYINSYSILNEHRVLLNGELLTFPTDDSSHFLTHIYKGLGIEYPKFFKMDDLCKGGFVASELLLRPLNLTLDEVRTDWAVVSFSSTSSLDTDIHYQSTIQSPEEYYPSPSVFVYTLANIMVGEVAIRHKIQGETSSFILPNFDAKSIVEVTNLILSRNKSLSKILCVWADCLKGHLDIAMWLLSNEAQSGAVPFDVSQLINSKNKIISR